MNKIYKFMDGRYGIDELYKFLLIICTILILLNIIIKSKIIDIIELIILIISTIRFLSKNKSKRQKENQIYIKIKNKIIKYYQYQKKRYQDHNTHIYRKCPKCKQKIRLPLKKGKHTVKCPNCQHHFIQITWKKIQFIVYLIKIERGKRGVILWMNKKWFKDKK